MNRSPTEIYAEIVSQSLKQDKELRKEVELATIQELQDMVFEDIEITRQDFECQMKYSPNPKKSKVIYDGFLNNIDIKKVAEIVKEELRKEK